MNPLNLPNPSKHLNPKRPPKKPPSPRQKNRPPRPSLLPDHNWSPSPLFSKGLKLFVWRNQTMSRARNLAVKTVDTPVRVVDMAGPVVVDLAVAHRAI